MEKEINGTVVIPQGYFLKMAKADYNSYIHALAREFLQNSIDAGARNIDVVVDLEKHEIEVADNGCGMTLEVIKDKLLVFGGSHKEEEGAVGAFGKAKELLYFSWDSYEIRTRNMVVTGSGSNYTIRKVSEYVKGTVSMIKMSNECMQSIKDSFQFVSKLMQTNAKIIVNGEMQGCICKRGRLVKSEEWVDIYQTKFSDAAYGSVRVNGIWMFDLYIGKGHGMLVFELKKYSTEILTSNRDGLNWKYSRQLEKLNADLLINKKSALNNENQKFIEIKGTGSVQVISPTVIEAMAAKELDISAMIARFAINAAHEERVRIIVDSYSAGRMNAETAQNQISFLGYEPDFIVNYTRSDRRVKAFMGTKRAKTIAKMWTEVVKNVLFDFEKYIQFTAGFTFDNKTNAKYLNKDDKHYFMLNPDTIAKNIGTKAVLSERTLLLKYLLQKACHEVIHLHTDYHDEDFIARFEQLQIKSWKSNNYKEISKINEAK